MSYSIDTNVLGRISHIKIPSGLLVSEFRDEAFSEININIRSQYVVPVVSADETDMDYLRDIEADIAGGRLVMDVAIAQSAKSMYAYGVGLEKRGLDKLQKIIDEKIILTGATLDTDSSNDKINFPSITGSAPDTYATFDRPMSGIENDAIEGDVDAEKYNSLEDTKEL